MAIDRRGFLVGIAACGFLRPTAGALADQEAVVLAAGRDGRGDLVAALDGRGRIVFAERLEGRGHGIAVSPDRRIAVVFSRRPGRFAVVLDLVGGRRIGRFEPPAGRHFYGHGVFAPDGNRLFATENAFGAERGVLGIYDARDGFRRLGEVPTHGIGPHQAIVLGDGRTLAVANGGIATHPDYPRRKLNVASMAPSLAYLDLATGALIEKASLPAPLRQLSLRHLAKSADGTVWWGGQYEGPRTDAVPLVGTHRRGGGAPTPVAAPVTLYRSMNHYVGSVAASADGTRIAATSPRGGRVVVWDAVERAIVAVHDVSDVCGLAPMGDGFVVSSGLGYLGAPGSPDRLAGPVAWDNHLAAL